MSAKAALLLGVGLFIGMLALAAALLSGLVRPGSKAAPTEATVEIPTRIALTVGEEYTLRLHGLGAAGYLWGYTTSGSDTAIAVAEMAAPPPPAPGNGPPPGGYSPDHVFVIRAREPGRVTLHFTQRRPWEQGQPALRQHTLEVTVGHR